MQDQDKGRGSSSNQVAKSREVEPWLRGTLNDVDAVRRGVLHALELAEEDIEFWCASLSDGEMFARPCGLPPVAFQLRHMTRSLDRLLTYAEDEGPNTGGRDWALSDAQVVALRTEMDSAGVAAEVLAEARAGFLRAMQRVRAVMPEQFAQLRGVGRERLPTTVAGLLIHAAEHTQRHAGQMVTTVKVVRNLFSAGLTIESPNV